MTDGNEGEKTVVRNTNFVSIFKTAANTRKYIQSLLKIGCNRNTVEMENYSSLDFSHSNAHHEKRFYTYSHLTSSSRDGQIHLFLGLTNTQISLLACMLCVCLSPTCDGQPSAPVFLQARCGFATWRRQCSWDTRRSLLFPGQVCKSFISSQDHSTLTYRGNGESTLSNKNPDRHRKYLHLYFGQFIIQLILKWFLG